VSQPEFQSPAVLKQAQDQQVINLQEHADATAASSAEKTVQTQGDPIGTGSLQRNPMQDTKFFMGKVLFALPFLHSYKVQMGGGASVEAILMGHGSSVAIGARISSLLPPGTNVCLYKPPGFGRHIILGAIPALCTDDKFNVAQIMQLGSNTQVRTQDGYRQLLNVLKDGGHINNFGAGRPLDGNVFEHSVITETGVSFLLDSYQIDLSVSEACGLFLNLFDNYTKLTGFQLDLESYAEHLRQRYDEGENVYVRGNITYPWEATGSYAAWEDFTTQVDAAEYQTKKEKPYGYYDLPEDKLDLAPIYRYMEYGGYLGQGYTRMLMKPAQESGQRRHTESDDPDYGLWQESVALDGSYTMRSAKSIYIGKYILIPIPKRERLVEDQENGDDARESNYKFSGEYGGGDSHKVSDVEVEGSAKNILRVSGVLDLLAYNYNWKNTHPFYYHKKDYKFPEESELSKLEKAQEVMDYENTSKHGYLKEPAKKSLTIDNRYGDVDYYQSMSYLTFLEDGGVALGDGYGSQITMTGGKIRLEAPNDIMILPGARSVTLCDEMFVRAKNNVEISSTDKDLRLKAEVNMQLLSGNGGKGGTLIENKSESLMHAYQGLYGDQIQDNGITLLTKKSDVGVLAKNIYIRSGADENGSITLDSSQGEKDIVCYSKTMNIFNSKGVNIWHSPVGKAGGSFDASHRFAKGVSLISGHLILQKHLCNPEGGVISRKTVVTAGNVVAVKKMAQKGGGFVGDSSQGGLPQDVADALDKCAEMITMHKNFGEPVWKAAFPLKYYNFPTVLGNEQLITNFMGFSFNDRPSGPGYHLDGNWGLIEERWQQYVRLNLASGGQGWTEKSVLYQGNKFYPYPGKQLWVDQPKLQQLQKFNIFDSGSAYSKDRPGSYEEPKISDYVPVVANGNYKLISKQ
jgi:hypothetical protein